jgi:hypothetical protein
MNEKEQLKAKLEQLFEAALRDSSDLNPGPLKSAPPPSSPILEGGEARLFTNESSSSNAAFEFPARAPRAAISAS